MSTRFVLDEIVDPFAARVLVTRDSDGHIAHARFDLSSLPRIDQLLAGQPVVEVTRVVERLCGICPVAHHLAGVQAVESLTGVDVDPAADDVRALLHYGSVVDALAVHLAARERTVAVAARSWGKAAMAAAGSPQHFPTTAVPGGARSTATEADLAAAIAAAPAGLEALTRLAADQLGDRRPEDFDGWNLALTDDVGRLHPLGSRARVVDANGDVAVEVPVGDLGELIVESCPGQPAPRPYIATGGPDAGRYRVGPVAQLLAADVATPRAADLRQRWLDYRSAAAARTIVAVAAVEAAMTLLENSRLLDLDDPGEPPVVDGVGVGAVDGPRGLLMHRYQVGGGVVTQATIMTPTAQNERWLADLLTHALRADHGLEDAVRAADPCLPCSSAPPGAMGLDVTDIEGGA